MFFKKLQALFHELPNHIKNISQDNERYIYNFEHVLADGKGYFNVTRGFVHIRYKMLTSNLYSVKKPIKESKLYLKKYVDINLL